VAHEVFEEAVGGVGSVDLVLGEDLIGEVGTSLEGDTLGLAQGVVTVEEDVLALQI
jgi:hypothetical protein